MSAYTRDFDETKYMTFLIKNDELLKNYKKFVKKLKIVSKKTLIVNLYRMKHLKIKIKSYNGKININFHNNKASE